MLISSSYSDQAKCVLSRDDCRNVLEALPNESIDLTISSPPYFMGKEYDKSKKIEDFIEDHRLILPELLRVTKQGGSICWQVGYHVTRSGLFTPLDYLVYEIFNSSEELFLQNRIIWVFGHGLHAKRKFSGRHEVILWFSKGRDYHFDLDPIRVPQKYPGKTYSKGANKGKPSGNPLGKNPGDVWEMPNVKAKHIEKTEHPCQFPVGLALRLVRALSPKNGRVFDPYTGSGSTGVAALLEGRKFVGAEIDKKYHRIAKTRCEQAFSNEIRYRPLDKPIQVPNLNNAVARKPANFA
ncbi:MAG TPA: site-specific DNA-methyltransferase [Pyrinomonadaceae bacterium]|nr:site-specific DNA-methyltransferase [Pyrinomonadaceae bacterium]